MQAPPSHADGQRCKDYDDWQFISGTLTVKTFPGRPNFTSVSAGDEPVRAYVVVLDKPMCMNEAKDPLDGEAMFNIREIQVSGEHIDKALVGKHVEAVGELHRAQTGWHHTAVLMLKANVGLPK